jgi:predicted metal-dependent HD superfamily phosphohydrolase
MDHTHFDSACRTLGATGNTQAAFRLLQAAYGQPHRAYHNGLHIDACLKWLERMRGHAQNPDEIAVALYFHDAVYTRLAITSNERRSAQLARRVLLELGVGVAHISRITKMIERTERHAMTDGEAADDPDLALMLDIDLSILGADPITYATFERDVAQEYAWVPLASLYRSKRKAILRGLLSRPKLYFSEPMAKLLEDRARRNLALAIDLIDVEGLLQHGGTTRAAAFFCDHARLSSVHPWETLQIVSTLPTGRVALGFNIGPNLVDGGSVARSDKESMSRLEQLPGYKKDLADTGHPQILWRRSDDQTAPADLPLPHEASSTRD